MSGPSFLSLKSHVFVCLCVGGYMCVTHMNRGQRTSRKGQFLSSTMWSPGVELRSLGLATRALLSEPSPFKDDKVRRKPWPVEGLGDGW